MGPIGGLSGSTIVERNLDRLTVGVASLFAITTVVLAFVLEA
jgi:preprotein translocase subunit SecG